MLPLIAQIESVPDGSFKAVFLTLLGLLGAAGTIFGIYAIFRKNSVDITPQPLEVRKAPKRYNHELIEQRHTEVVRRLDEHDAELDALDQARQNDLKANADMNLRIVAALARIEGRLGIKPQEEKL